MEVVIERVAGPEVHKEVVMAAVQALGNQEKRCEFNPHEVPDLRVWLLRRGA
jgi:hypothetical protein